MTETATTLVEPYTPTAAPKLDFNNLRHQTMDTDESPPFIAMVVTKVSIHGLFAETKITFTLFNPNKRDMEGELVIPLPSTAVLCGHALDINGRMREAVIVGKKEGRRILEAEIRKDIDPGLVEKVQGNIHRIRVYPLPGMGWRTVSVTWVSELSLEQNSPSFHLPLGYLKDVDESTLEVALHDQDAKPKITGGRGGLQFVFQEEENKWQAACILNKGSRVDDLLIQLPALQTQKEVIIEQDTTGERFFCISRPAPVLKSSPQQWKPSQIAIAWDSSGSRIDIAKELDLLSCLLYRWQEVTIDLLVFRNSVEKTEQQSFIISKGNSDQLINFLKALPCDGATDLSALDLSKLPHPETEAWLLFSDGLVTSGNGYPDGAPVMAHSITSQVMNNSFLLTRIAEQCGGSFYNLVDQSVSQVCDAVLSGNRQIVQPVALKGCEAVQIKKRGSHTLIIGRLINDKGLALLRENDGECEFPLNGENAVASRTLARLWACEQAETGFLLERNSAMSINLGRRYGVVTSGTSLLVLDTLEQYLEYDVEPPASEQDFLDRYRYRKRQAALRERDEQKSQLDSVHKDWLRKISWWETEFSIKPKKNKKKIARLPGRADVQSRRGSSDIRIDGICSIDMCCMEEVEEDIEYGSISMGREIACMAREPQAPAPAPKQQSRKGISVQQWKSDMPYLKELEQAAPKDRYPLYLALRQEYLNAPSFYLDCGDYFLKTGEMTMGVRILSNLLELDLENPALMRTCAYRLQQAGALDAAIAIFTDVLDMRDDEPQSHRDLALALAECWQRDKQEQDLFAAMLHLWSVVKTPWSRFPEIEMIALLELNRLIRLARKNTIAVPDRIESRFQKTLDLDLRISMAWDADLTDVDLHVLEPTGEHASYSHRKTRQGARVSRDVVDGYGPEEYILRKAVKGTYVIKAHYYSSSQQKINGSCTVMVTLFTDFARDSEKQQSLVLRLDKAGDDFVVGEITID